MHPSNQHLRREIFSEAQFAGWSGKFRREFKGKFCQPDREFESYPVRQPMQEAIEAIRNFSTRQARPHSCPHNKAWESVGSRVRTTPTPNWTGPHPRHLRSARTRLNMQDRKTGPARCTGWTSGRCCLSSHHQTIAPPVTRAGNGDMVWPSSFARNSAGDGKLLTESFPTLTGVPGCFRYELATVNSGTNSGSVRQVCFQGICGPSSLVSPCRRYASSRHQLVDDI